MPAVRQGPSTYLAFDLGASSGRAILGTLDGDRMRMEEIHRFPTPTADEGDHLFWDVEALWGELKEGLARALETSPGLRSLSVDSWAVDYVPLDEAGSPLRLPCRYRDPRTNGVMERAFEILPADAIYAHTGIQFLPFNTLFQLLADEEEAGRISARADGGERSAGGTGRDPGAGGVGEARAGTASALVPRYLTMADFFNYRFSGKAVVEVSMASTTQLMEVGTRAWSLPVFEAFGLEPSRWPPIVPSGTALGTARDAPTATVLATCSHDTGCAVAAVPATEETSWAFVSSGTWSLLGTERSEPLLTPAARMAGFTHEAGIDDTIRFLKNLTGLWALQECVREWGEVAWDALESEARSAPPGLTLIDLEDPRFLSPGGMPHRLRAFCREKGLPVPETRGALVRAILESIARSYEDALASLEDVTGESVEVLHVVGGGSRNRLLCQLAADACRRTVVAGPAEATALGNLLLQARTLGDLPPARSLRSIAASSSELETYRPTSSLS
jgi:rhamnulokinase